MSPTPNLPASDPYADQPPLWARYPFLGWPLGVIFFTTMLTLLSFPPGNIGEAAFVFALPAILWAYKRPSFRLYARTVLGAQALAWILVLGWLHNVTWVGLFLLGPFIGLLIGVWYLAAWWAIGRTQGHPAMVRIIGMLGLAALWVVLEWVRSWIFGGFPWLPLAASQWQRPLVLQIASFAGAGAVSFVLIMFNLGAAAYAHRIFFEGATGLRKRSPEFMLALMLLVFTSFPFLTEILGQQRQKLANVTVVQPYIPQNEKWDQARATETLRTIERVTFDAADRAPSDFLVWPEAVTPWALQRDPNVAAWMDSVAKRVSRPLLLGSVSVDNAGSENEQWFNAAFVVDPRAGVQFPGYAKRKLVPFGEYIPLRPVFGWLSKVVPIGGDFQRGTTAQPLVLAVDRQPLRIGVLICYEDIFPALARDSAMAGADLLVVLTNNGWFGEGGAAYQHAAHSVLRAVETRRPVLRCGNGGWSGWIDEFGYIRATVADERGSVYFRGSQLLKITRDLRWRDRQSFFTEHGDWFLAVCTVLVTAAYYVLVTLRPPATRADGAAAF